jgi:hypothetical protein
LPGQTNRMKARLTMTPRDGVMCEVTKRTWIMTRILQHMNSIMSGLLNCVNISCNGTLGNWNFTEFQIFFHIHELL